MKITKEDALEAAARRGFQIPDWMLEKAEKKRGRPAASGAVVTKKVESETTEYEPKTKEKKPRQPRAKATTAKKTATSVATNDTPQKKNSVQSSICVDLNQENLDDDATPVAVVDADAASTPIPQEKEKKKRGRPTKSGAQNNVGESEMQRLIIQATTEKKKRLSLDPTDTCPSSPSSQEEGGQVETCLNFENEVKENVQEDEDENEIFDMFEKILEEEERNQQQQQQEEVVAAAATVEPVVATNEKKEKKEKKEKSKKATKKSDEENVEKTEKKKHDKIAKKEAAAIAAKKKAEEEAAALAAKKDVEEEEDEETEDEENEEEEELECEEYEYEGETYGLAPNGDIYSQDGDLVGKLDNGTPKMFN